MTKMSANLAWYHRNRDQQVEKKRREYAENGDKIRAQKRAAYQRNRDRMAERRLASRLSAYGITPEDYWRMHDAQGGRCGLCEKPELSKQNGRTVRLSVDHDHDTGRVRALLCRSCNARLGILEDRSFRARAQNYLTYYNAVAILRGH